ncbi:MULTISPECIES: hydratase [Sinorhizobium]|uniref:Hydratase n=2 Tax=Sinorhizobium TaxID=28105 RepID=A0A2S3YV70_9HYPH|nr:MULTISPECIES: hydratase [Sinorhizobium]AUX80680.1 fumarylacetoacetate hydrolase protein [Sinorhizobium fredii]PDT39590.1 hydratase [Sinorhizobium sp. FG01]POH35517.1 hydratase [Sinorhizobium americanum]
MTHATLFDAADLAHRFATAKDRIAAAELPVPATIAEAIAVQVAFVAPEDGVAGYKVARSPEGMSVAGRLSPIAAHADAEPATFRWRNGLRVEAEIGFRLAAGLPPREAGYSRDAVIAAIGSIHLGVEVLDSRIEEGGKAPFLLFLADRLGNAGYAFGPELPREFLDGAEGRPLEVSLDGAPLFAGEAHHPASDVLAWLVGWANETERAEDTLSAGEIVTTGSLCGALDVAAPGRIDVRLDGRWSLAVRFE